MERIAARDVIVDAGGANEIVVEDIGEERIWEVAEELFEDAGDAVDVVKEVLLFAEVDGGGICLVSSKLPQTQSASVPTIVKYLFYPFNVLLLPRKPVYSLNIKPIQIHSLDTLKNQYWNHRFVASQKCLQRLPKHRPRSGIVHIVVIRSSILGLHRSLLGWLHRKHSRGLYDCSKSLRLG